MNSGKGKTIGMVKRSAVARDLRGGKDSAIKLSCILYFDTAVENA